MVLYLPGATTHLTHLPTHTLMVGFDACATKSLTGVVLGIRAQGILCWCIYVQCIFK